MKFKLLALVLFACPALSIAAPAPDCGSPNGWAAAMSFATLKNKGLLTNDMVDFTKTEVRLIASENLGLYKPYKEDLYRLVFDIVYHKKSGERIEMIAVHDATRTECSMSSVDVFVASAHFATGKDAPLAASAQK